MNKIPEKQLKSFYKSSEWQRLRNDVYRKLTPFCPVCGTENNLVVDHIKPVRLFWEERLNEDNLQILCNDCNLEKGYMTNWTLEYHIKNKSFLQQQRKQKEDQLDRKEEIEKLNELYAYFSNRERIEIDRGWDSYLSLSKKLEEEKRLKKYDFLRYIISKKYDLPRYGEDSPFIHIKPYVRKHYEEFIKLPEDIDIHPELILDVKVLKQKKKNIIRRITKDGKVIEYEKN